MQFSDLVPIGVENYDYEDEFSELPPLVVRPSQPKLSTTQRSFVNHKNTEFYATTETAKPIVHKIPRIGITFPDELLQDANHTVVISKLSSRISLGFICFAILLFVSFRSIHRFTCLICLLT